MISLAGIARRRQSRAPMETLDSVGISPESGVEGDSRGRPGKRQVTLLSRESWDAACRDAGVELPWSSRRANLLLDGFEFLPTDVGSRVYIGTVELEITRETDPCQRMDDIHPGLREALAPSWRGGVCCRVIAGGSIRVGDPVSIRRADEA